MEGFSLASKFFSPLPCFPSLVQSDSYSLSGNVNIHLLHEKQNHMEDKIKAIYLEVY